MTTVIRVENLGKKYRIHHQQRERYTALRDVIANRAKSLFRNSQFSIHNSQLDEDFWALKDVSFEIKQGEVVGIIGRNGAGKSTLLKILSRITEPTTGRVSIKGRIASLLEVGTGFHPELTGRENIYLNGAILGMSRLEVVRKFDEIVDFAEIEKFLDTPVKRYSSGMYMRLAFAVAAHLEPEILVVDEVLAVGDAEFQKKCLGKMSTIASEGRTVIFVSHNMAAINNLCEKVAWLESGNLSQTGLPNELIRRYLAQHGGDDKSESEQDKLRVDDEEIDILGFYISDESGNKKKSFLTSESVAVHIKYRIKKRLPGLRVGFDLAEISFGEVIFRSFDDDLVYKERVVGEYHATGIVPGDLIKSGSYMIKLQIGVHNVRWIINGTLSVTFDMECIDGVNSQYNDLRPGLIQPGLVWIGQVIQSKNDSNT